MSLAIAALAPHLPRYQRSMANYARPLDGEDYVFPARRGGLISHYETRERGAVAVAKSAVATSVTRSNTC